MSRSIKQQTICIRFHCVRRSTDDLTVTVHDLSKFLKQGQLKTAGGLGQDFLRGPSLFRQELGIKA